MGLVIVFESPFGGSLFVNVRCMFFTIRAVCNGGGRCLEGKWNVRENRVCVCVCQLEQVPGGPQGGWRENHSQEIQKWKQRRKMPCKDQAFTAVPKGSRAVLNEHTKSGLAKTLVIKVCRLTTCLCLASFLSTEGLTKVPSGQARGLSR